MKDKLVIITGPTAVGKTALSVKLAKRISAEIISADSMQVYKGMNIGTAKVTEEEKGGVTHHLIDIIEPSADFNVYEFKKYATRAAEDIVSRGKIPIVAGGTGFYIRALLYDAEFEELDESGIRKELEYEALKKGKLYMHEKLSKIDPEYAKSVHPNNQKRVIRAIEYYMETGERFSDYNKRLAQKESPYDFKYFVLTDDRETMYANIEKRVDMMIKNGLEAEVRRLLDSGIDIGCTSMQAIGYREMTEYINGLLSFDEAVSKIKTNTRHYAKRQLTWFRGEKDAVMIDKRDFGHDDDKILEYIAGEIDND